MPDIAKCLGGKCPRKDTCYRYLSKADEYQTFVDYANNLRLDSNCYLQCLNQSDVRYWDRWAEGNGIDKPIGTAKETDK